MKRATGQAVDAARDALVLDRAGLPVCRDSHRVHAAMRALEAEPDAFAELVGAGFLARAAERFHQYVEPQLRAVPGGLFDMGTAPNRAQHFCGETPRRRVELSAFTLSAVQVTNELYGLMDPGRRSLAGRAAATPAVGVGWYDCAVFAAWVGCRLPTEAEWEFACGAGTAGQWCCPENELSRYCWYSENAGERLHPVGTRVPNELGLFDLHGNVWEWCQDVYADDYYSRAPRRDPVNEVPAGGPASEVHRVARGGGYLALAEMCRTRYRTHDPAYYHATDLGFRLAGPRASETS